MVSANVRHAYQTSLFDYFLCNPWGCVISVNQLTVMATIILVRNSIESRLSIEITAEALATSRFKEICSDLAFRLFASSNDRSFLTLSGVVVKWLDALISKVSTFPSLDAGTLCGRGTEDTIRAS